MMRPLCLALALALLCGCGRSAAVLRESTVRVSAPVYGVFVRSELLWPDCGGGLDELQRVSAAVGAPASGAFSHHTDGLEGAPAPGLEIEDIIEFADAAAPVPGAGRVITRSDWKFYAVAEAELVSALEPGDECTLESGYWSGMELTLHYAAGDIVPGKVTLTHARFFYPDLRALMTETGLAATDNSRWMMVAVTFDDGPKDYPSTYTLDALRKIGARGTYFIVGKQLERYGYVLQKQYDQNHIFGTHTFHHWGGGSFKSDESRLKELTLSAEWTLPLVGEEASLFRAPGGTYPSWVESGMPLPIIQWSVDTYDYTGKSPKRIFYTFRDKVTEGDIILCHDTGEYLHESVPLWGEYLLERGFMFVTVDELACAYGLDMQPSVVYWSVRPGESSLDR